MRCLMMQMRVHARWDDQSRYYEERVGDYTLRIMLKIRQNVALYLAYVAKLVDECHILSAVQVARTGKKHVEIEL